MTKDAPKYAPANTEGLKPFVVEEYLFGKPGEHLVYANNAAESKHALYRMRYATYSSRRATPADVERLEDTE
jgi:hypothetical protein